WRPPPPRSVLGSYAACGRPEEVTAVGVSICLVRPGVVQRQVRENVLKWVQSEAGERAPAGCTELDATTSGESVDGREQLLAPALVEPELPALVESELLALVESKLLALVEPELPALVESELLALVEPELP